MFMGIVSAVYKSVDVVIHLHCLFVGFFVDPGPLSPDPTLAGKKNNFSSLLSSDFLVLFWPLNTIVKS